jgi:hypothetical protein
MLSRLVMCVFVTLRYVIPATATDKGVLQNYMQNQLELQEHEWADYEEMVRVNKMNFSYVLITSSPSY